MHKLFVDIRREISKKNKNNFHLISSVCEFILTLPCYLFHGSHTEQLPWPFAGTDVGPLERELSEKLASGVTCQQQNLH